MTNEKEKVYMPYTGIGSRNTPNQVKDMFERMGIWLAKKGYTLRSGKADGADEAFERGCDAVAGKKEIYLPWKRFNSSDSLLYLERLKNKNQAIKIADLFHPNLSACNESALKLLTRDTYQILGEDLESFSLFVICYTERGEEKGGTAQALRIAKHYNIPIFNAGQFCIYDGREIYFEEERCVKEFNHFFEVIKV